MSSVNLNIHMDKLLLLCSLINMVNSGVITSINASRIPPESGNKKPEMKLSELLRHLKTKYNNQVVQADEFIVKPLNLTLMKPSKRVVVTPYSVPKNLDTYNSKSGNNTVKSFQPIHHYYYYPKRLDYDVKNQKHPESYLEGRTSRHDYEGSDNVDRINYGESKYMGPNYGGANYGDYKYAAPNYDGSNPGGTNYGGVNAGDTKYGGTNYDGSSYGGGNSAGINYGGGNSAGGNPSGGNPSGGNLAGGNPAGGNPAGISSSRINYDGGNSGTNSGGGTSSVGNPTGIKSEVIPVESNSGGYGKDNPSDGGNTNNFRANGYNGGNYGGAYDGSNPGGDTGRVNSDGNNMLEMDSGVKPNRVGYSETSYGISNYDHGGYGGSYRGNYYSGNNYEGGENGGGNEELKISFGNINNHSKYPGDPYFDAAQQGDELNKNLELENFRDDTMKLRNDRDDEIPRETTNSYKWSSHGSDKSYKEDSEKDVHELVKVGKKGEAGYEQYDCFSCKNCPRVDLYTPTCKTSKGCVKMVVETVENFVIEFYCIEAKISSETDYNCYKKANIVTTISCLYCYYDKCNGNKFLSPYEKTNLAKVYRSSAIDHEKFLLIIYVGMFLIKVIRLL